MKLDYYEITCSSNVKAVSGCGLAPSSGNIIHSNSGTPLSVQIEINSSKEKNTERYYVYIQYTGTQTQLQYIPLSPKVK